MTDSVKICKRCGVELPITRFSTVGQGRRRNVCRNCRPSEVRKNKRRKIVHKERRAAFRSRFGNACEICNKTEELVVDHDHNKLIIRGVLCSTCNRAIGLLRDNSILLRKAIEYLEKSRPEAETVINLPGYILHR